MLWRKNSSSWASWEVTVTVVVVVLWMIRLWCILPSRVKKMLLPNQWKNHVKENNQRPRDLSTACTLIVLGSGGHTTEILKITSTLNKERYCPVYFVVANTDTTSISRVSRIWGSVKEDAFITIPRSREVGQSWMSTILSTLNASWTCLRVVYKINPELLLCNGPGTCIPVCCIAVLFNFLGITQTKILFCESFARVKSLSLTGRIVYFLADVFIVHWPELCERYPHAQYIGTIC